RIQRRRILIGLNATVDKPPIQAFYARVFAEYEGQDLVLLEMTEDVFGRPLPDDLELPWVPIGDSTALRLGQTLWVAGFPEDGSSNYRTPVIVGRGIVAGLEREAEEATWLKTDAWIAPGHSGGPVMDDQGGLVGLSAATLGGTESLGLAVPISRLPEPWRTHIQRDLR
ncbi:MAG: S1 family peptidase, partial [Planctomycetota bacterium]